MKSRVLLVFGLMPALAACGSSKAAATSPTPVVTTTTSSAAPTLTATIDIPAADYAAGKTLTTFAPGNVEVLAGGTVTWTNNDIVAHTSTSTAGTPLWNQEMSAGARFSRVFPTVGAFDYRCSIHAGMVGTVTVR